MHFEDGKGAQDPNARLRRLRKHMPHFDKANLDVAALEPGIADAVGRAKKRDMPPATDWPREVGTTVYRLEERLQDVANVGAQVTLG